jgi:hypothetical protein
MEKVMDFYCDTPEAIKLVSKYPELVRHLAIYMEEDLFEQRGYIATYFSESEKGKMVHYRTRGENILEELIEETKKFAESEIVSDKGIFIKRKFSLIPIKK